VLLKDRHINHVKCFGCNLVSRVYTQSSFCSELVIKCINLALDVSVKYVTLAAKIILILLIWRIQKRIT